MKFDVRLIVLGTVLFCCAALDIRAQSACPTPQFKNAPSASLTPSANTRRYLARQADGSYASYESSVNPYQFIAVTPHFEKQLTECLPEAIAAPNPRSIAPANPIGAPSQPQAVAVLDSGDYLVVTPSSYLSIGNTNLVVSLFDNQLNLSATDSCQLDLGTSLVASFGLADLNGDGNPALVAIAMTK